MSSAKSLPYPVLVVVLVLAFAMMRCAGEYGQEQERDARIDERVSSPIVQLIPDCGRGHVYFAVDNGGIVRYWCGR